MRSSIISARTRYYYDDEIKEDEMGGACSIQGKMKNAYEVLVR
jgi:hypothetical protein